MSSLLFDESPLVVQPNLAKAIGLNEAIVLQQIHYWIHGGKSGKDINGVRWIYNSLSDWQEQFPFWSESTIYRTLKSLEENKLIKTGRFNQRKGDRTQWFTIAYDQLKYIEMGGDRNSLFQDETPKLQNGTAKCQDETTLPETSSETSPETTTNLTRVSTQPVKQDGESKEVAAVAVQGIYQKKEPEPDRKVAITFQLYQQQIGVINPRLAELVREDIEDIPLEWIPLAFDRAAAANANKWAYVKGTLQNWKAQGGPQDRKNESANAPPVDPSLYRHEDWVKLQGAPGETVEQTFDRLKKEQRIPSNAILRRSNHNGRISQNQ